MKLGNLLKKDDSSFYMAEKNDIQNLGIVGLMSEIHKGIIRIPDFQRDYVWKISNVDDLLESIIKDYPLGAILLWKTQEKLEERDPLDLKLPDPHQNAERLYLLDGQQRLVTLYSLLVKGYVKIGKRGSKYHAFYNLKDRAFKIFNEEELIKESPKIENGFIATNKIFIFDSLFASVSLDEGILNELKGDAKLIMSYNELHNKFNSISFPAIISAKNLSTACRIFERLNNTGTQLTIADLMVAITYKADFNLRDKMEELNNLLAPQDYEVSERTILQSMASCLQKGTRREDIIESSSLFATNWDKVCNSIKLSIDFLKNNCSVPVSKFLPNEIIIPVLSRFFYQYGNKQPSIEYIKKLRQYFWVSAIYSRYASSQDSVAKSDITIIDDILNNSQKSFDFSSLLKSEGLITSDMIQYEDMDFGSSFSKAIMCFLASQSPKEFRNNTIISLDQTFSEANLRQVHHIFPINYLKKNVSGKKEKNIARYFSNSVANISLIPASTNRDIWDTKPSIYFSKFEADNTELDLTLKTHLIGNLKEFGLKDDDFETFIKSRSTNIANSINLFIQSL